MPELKLPRLISFRLEAGSYSVGEVGGQLLRKFELIGSMEDGTYLVTRLKVDEGQTGDNALKLYIPKERGLKIFGNNLFNPSIPSKVSSGGSEVDSIFVHKDKYELRILLSNMRVLSTSFTEDKITQSAGHFDEDKSAVALTVWFKVHGNHPKLEVEPSITEIYAFDPRDN